MSSFRPSSTAAPRGFEPRPLSLLEGGFSSRSLAEPEPEGSTAETPDRAAAESSSEAPEVETRVLTAEQIEAIERAAFERGTAQATLEVEAGRRAFESLERATRTVERDLATRPTTNREAMVELIGEIVMRWVGAELRLDVTRIADRLEAVLEDVIDASPHAVYLNPEDLAAIESADEDRVTSWARQAALEIMGDEALARGDFRIDLAHGVVDGRLERVRRDLVERLCGAFDAPLPEPEPGVGDEEAPA